jgi:hypothetical protein
MLKSGIIALVVSICFDSDIQREVLIAMWQCGDGQGVQDGKDLVFSVTTKLQGKLFILDSDRNDLVADLVLDDTTQRKTFDFYLCNNLFITVWIIIGKLYIPSNGSWHIFHNS